MDRARLPVERRKNERPPRRDEKQAGERARWSPPTVQRLDVVHNTAATCCGLDMTGLRT